MASIETLFSAIKSSDTSLVRSLLAENHSLTSAKHRDATIKFAPEVELDSYVYLGAYLGAITALQYAILMGNDAIAKDILERTVKDDLDIPFGGGNTALHLATFLGASEIVKLLLEQGANRQISNSKGYKPVDSTDSTEMKALFA
ncbi:hypothetical protein PhCBS80983_g01771 [Powellomyces hirtus]|uniref:Uncharacterized protein n=1 Tax=Powellomyces hirtus TaxID=109895 RepID=A0A507E8N8_9FUNG|nr:hypothetical protein DFJ77DRAFT_450798 [Powellomyces hirtus]TPX60429.1 hypothetical protein PhCBS80983_g01771 [Powellomyces hirtus]